MGIKLRISKLDKLVSEYVRKRAIQRVGGCERCLRPKYDIQKDNGKVLPAWKQLQWAHLQPRRNKSIRWDEDAAAGLCGGCHMLIDSNAEEKIALCKRLIGEDGYEQLLSRSRMICKPDEKALTLYYQMKLREVE